VIPDEAVEAAAEAIDYALQTGMGVGDMARDALEAAAPHLLAQGWDEGYKAGLFDKEYYAHNPNPHKQDGLDK